MKPPDINKFQISDFKFQTLPPRHAPPPGFVHVDLDGLWTLAGCYGYDEGDSFRDDPVFERALPRLLGLLGELELKATFFIVGRDLELAEKSGAVREIARRGHELANHSWSHRFGLEAAADGELQSEIERTSAALEALSGRRPAGFRAPGYTAGPRLLAACARAGIRYDGSRLPTLAAPLLRRAAGRLRAQVRREAMAQGRTPPPPPPPGLELQYGGRGGLAPRWVQPEAGGPALLELPLAVSPVLRLPLHASLGQVLGERFVTAGLRRLARRGAPVSYLLHGMDLLGAEDLDGRLPRALARTRPFQAALAAKLDFLRKVLPAFKELTRVQLTSEWVEGEWARHAE